MKAKRIIITVLAVCLVLLIAMFIKGYQDIQRINVAFEELITNKDLSGILRYLSADTRIEMNGNEIVFYPSDNELAPTTITHTSWEQPSVVELGKNYGGFPSITVQYNAVVIGGTNSESSNYREYTVILDYKLFQYSISSIQTDV